MRFFNLFILLVLCIFSGGCSVISTNHARQYMAESYYMGYYDGIKNGTEIGKSIGKIECYYESTEE